MGNCCCCCSRCFETESTRGMLPALHWIHVIFILQKKDIYLAILQHTTCRIPGGGSSSTDAERKPLLSGSSEAPVSSPATCTTARQSDPKSRYVYTLLATDFRLKTITAHFTSQCRATLFPSCPFSFTQVMKIIFSFCFSHVLTSLTHIIRNFPCSFCKYQQHHQGKRGARGEE